MAQHTAQASIGLPLPAGNVSSPVDDASVVPNIDANSLTSSSSSTGEVSPPPDMSSLPGRDAPQAPATLRPLLDHRMFPHIMDMIIESAPREALFSLSRTSKDMWARTARLLPTHIRVTEVDKKYLYELSDNDPVVVKRIMAKHSAPAVVAAHTNRKLQTGDRWSFEAVKIVDFDGYHIPTLLFRALSTAHTVRFNNRIPVCVRYWGSVKKFVIRDHWGRRECLGANFENGPLFVREGVEKIVCNIDYDARSNRGNCYLESFILSETVRDVVIIFTNVDDVAGDSLNPTDPRASQTPAQRSATRSPAVAGDSIDVGSEAVPWEPIRQSPTPSLYSLETLYNPLFALGGLRRLLPRCPTTKVKYSLVGATLVPPRCFGIPGPALSSLDLETAIIDQMAVRHKHVLHGHRSWQPAHQDAARISIRVMTKSEYRDEIGEMDYLLETEW